METDPNFFSHVNYGSYVLIPKDGAKAWQSHIKELISNRPVFLFFVLGPGVLQNTVIAKASQLVDTDWFVIGLPDLDVTNAANDEIVAFLCTILKDINGGAITPPAFNNLLAFSTTMDDRIAYSFQLTDPNPTDFGTITTALDAALANN